MNDLELKIIKTLCDFNENLTLTVYEKSRTFVYRSRFLEFQPQKALIIDKASAETANAKPLTVGQDIEVYFEFKDFRYIFISKILAHTQYNIGTKEVFALKIVLPDRLTDGERREYFRIEVPVKPTIKTSFNVFKNGSRFPVMSSLVKGQPEEFEAIIVDVSGGGFAMKSEDKYWLTDLVKGDIINARFKLKPDFPEMEIWSEVRNRRKYKDTDKYIWGLLFLENEKNKSLKGYRNKIMRYVTERQRQILFK